VSLKAGKNDGYCTYKPTYMYDHISLNSSWNENITDKPCEENQNTHFTFNDISFFENRAAYEIMWKNMLQPDRPQMAIYS